MPVNCFLPETTYFKRMACEHCRDYEEVHQFPTRGKALDFAERVHGEIVDSKGVFDAPDPDKEPGPGEVDYQDLNIPDALPNSFEFACRCSVCNQAYLLSVGENGYDHAGFWRPSSGIAVIT